MLESDNEESIENNDERLTEEREGRKRERERARAREREREEREREKRDGGCRRTASGPEDACACAKQSHCEADEACFTDDLERTKPC